MMKNYAFIFARQGSKGLPRKNIKLLEGKPLIQYSIDIALMLRQVDKVFVSTDDETIAQIALAGGATVIERPKSLAGDTSPEWLAWQHACEWVTQRYGSFDGFISLPATSPLRSVNDVEQAIKRFYSTSADICICVTPSNRSPHFNMVKVLADGSVGLVNPPDKTVARRQDAPLVFDIAPVAYVTSPRFINRASGVFDGTVTAIEVPRDRAVDIDDIYDFMFAEAILKANMHGKNRTDE